MPRAGIHCPIDQQNVSDETCLACRLGAPRAGVHCVYPFELLKGMMNDAGRERAHISATMLGGICPRQTWLQSREPWHASPERMYPALRGTIGHAMVEMHPEPGAIVEQRFEAVIDGITVTGQIDKLHPGNRTITDFKTKAEGKKAPDAPQQEHIWQLNTYRWLVRHGWPQEPIRDGRTTLYTPGTPANIEIDRLFLVYWTFGWVAQIEVPVLPEAEVAHYIASGAAVQAAPEPPDVPGDLDPWRSTFCRDWCPVRMACVHRLADDDEF
jgi:hypothetical protein